MNQPSQRSAMKSNINYINFDDNFSYKTMSKVAHHIDQKKILLSRKRINDRVKEGLVIAEKQAEMFGPSNRKESPPILVNNVLMGFALPKYSSDLCKKYSFSMKRPDDHKCLFIENQNNLKSLDIENHNDVRNYNPNDYYVLQSERQPISQPYSAFKKEKLLYMSEERVKGGKDLKTCLKSDNFKLTENSHRHMPENYFASFNEKQSVNERQIVNKRKSTNERIKVYEPKGISDVRLLNERISYRTRSKSSGRYDSVKNATNSMKSSNLRMKDQLSCSPAVSRKLSQNVVRIDKSVGSSPIRIKKEYLLEKDSTCIANNQSVPNINKSIFLSSHGEYANRYNNIADCSRKISTASHIDYANRYSNIVDDPRKISTVSHVEELVQDHLDV